MKKYRVIKKNDDPFVEVGEVLYEFRGHTYGCLSEDERMLKVDCGAFTRDPEGKNPFIILPLHIVGQIN